jgi:transcriptional regulator with XRE-family HTH domain
LENPLGTFLRGLRTMRGLSVRGLAQQARLSPSTLSRWEGGRTLPRLPELDAVLEALEVTPSAHARALALLNAPRAVVRVRQEAQRQAALAGLEHWPPVSGDLLRALRLRAGRTLVQVSQAVGVSESAASAWERNEKWPSAEHLHALCWFLGASEAEIAALTAGPYVWTPPETTARAAIEAARAQLRALIYAPWSGAAPEVGDLAYLGIEARLWPLMGRDAGAQRLLSEANAWRSFHLVQNYRYREGGRVAERALDLLPDKARPEWFALYAVFSLAQSLVKGSARPRPERGLEVLRLWLTDETKAELEGWRFGSAWMPARVYAGWAALDRAHYLGMMGRTEEALNRIETALHVEAHTRETGAPFLLELQKGRLLIQAGRASAALDVVTSERTSAANEAQYALLRAEGLLELDSRAEAERALSDAYAWTTQDGSTYWQSRLKVQADTLASRL